MSFLYTFAHFCSYLPREFWGHGYDTELAGGCAGKKCNYFDLTVGFLLLVDIMAVRSVVGGRGDIRSCLL